MNADELTRKYGKQLTQELMDIMFINGTLSSESAWELLVKHGVIKKTTKIINVWLQTIQNYRYRGDTLRRIYFRNGRGQTVLSLDVLDTQLHDVQELLNAE